MGLISISNHKKVTWTKFEQNPLENKSFEIFISETPVSQRTFGKIALTAFREPKSTYLFYNHNFFSFKTFIFSYEIEKISNGKKVMAPGSYSKKFFGISTFQMMYQSNFFFKNHKTELMGVDKIKKYVLTQKISLLAWKIAVLQTFLYHFRTPENPNISKAHIFWLATVMSRTKLILTWFDILLSLEHSGAWPHGAFLISSILRAVK